MRARTEEGDGKGSVICLGDLGRRTVVCEGLSVVVRSLDEIRDCVGRYEAATSNDHTGKTARVQELVNRISRNAAQEFSRFLNRVQ